MPSYDDVMTALRNADAAGDKDAAERLAAIAAKLRDSQSAAPAPDAPQRRNEIPTGGTDTAPIYAKPYGMGAAPPPAENPPAEKPGMLGFLTGAPRAGMPQAPGMGMLGSAARKVIAPVETAVSVASGATTGFLGGLLNAGNRIAQQITGIVSGQNADEIKASGPSVEEAFTQGMNATTYQPRTPEAQAQTEAIGSALQEHGPALIAINPELGALGKILSRGAKPAAAMAGETAGNAARETTKKVLGVNPEKLKVAKLAEDFGIDVRPDQVMDSKAAALAGEGVSHIPLTGSKTKSNLRQFTGALNKLLNPEETADRITPETFSKAMDRSGKTVGEIMGGVEVPFEEGGLAKSLGNYEKSLGTETADTTRIGSNYVEQLRAKAEENGGTIPGEALRTIDSEIGAKIRSTADGDLKRSLSDLQEHIRDAAEAQIKDPADRTRLKDARRQYAWGKLVEPYVATSIDGNFSPAALMGAITRTKAGKGFMARNAGGRIGDLAKVGKLLKEPTTSNTAERAAVYGLATGAHIGSGGLTLAAGNAYNRLGPKLTRALSRGGEEAPAVAAGEVPPAEPPPPTGGQGPAPETPPAPTDPRLAEVAKLRENATSEAVRAALDAHEKSVLADIKAKAAEAKKQADVAELEKVAQSTQDANLRKALQDRADKLRSEKIPVGEVTELASTPVPKPEKVGKIPVGKVIEGQPEIATEKTGPIPVGEATEITPEHIEPPEPIPVGEATEITPVSNRPAAEVVSNRPQAEPVSNRPVGETAPVSNVPQAEARAYAHRALFEEAAKRGIEVRGRRPSEVRAAYEADWAKEHGLNPMDAQRAKTVAQALNIDEKAVEAAAVQHERSPRAFDRAIDDIIRREAENASETHEATGSSEGSSPNPSGAVGATEAPVQQPRANSPAAPGANVEGNQSGRPSGERIVTDKRGDQYAVKVTQENFGADKSSKSVLVEVRDPKTGERRGFVDFEVRPDGVLTAGNVKVAPEFRGRDLAPMMYKAARDAGFDIAPGGVQTDLGNKLVDKLVDKLVKQGIINKEATGPRFKAGDLDLAPIEGETIPGEKATRPEPKGFEKGARERTASKPQPGGKK